MSALVKVPHREDVSVANQALFDKLEAALGRVPNLYATFAHSEPALANYLALQYARSSIAGKAREVVNLVASQVNACEYCLAAHTAVGRAQGFDELQLIEIRCGRASFDPRLDALARLTYDIVERRGHADPAVVDAFFAAGWTPANLVDVIVAIGDKTITNYLHATTRVPVDFPPAPVLA
ncbi:MAG: carboxymuconolactone decarboxylase family protein [Pelomonas sp.]|nr:carboxymuconolactone decarboxylase family protein [Roseateles sp.]